MHICKTRFRKTQPTRTTTDHNVGTTRGRQVRNRLHPVCGKRDWCLTSCICVSHFTIINFTVILLAMRSLIFVIVAIILFRMLLVLITVSSSLWLSSWCFGGPRLFCLGVKFPHLSLLTLHELAQIFLFFLLWHGANQLFFYKLHISSPRGQTRNLLLCGVFKRRCIRIWS